VAKRKKSRTPAPPRRPAAPKSDGQARQVQAPQVRTKRRTQAETERRNRLILYGVAGAGIVGLAIALIAVFAVGRGNNGSTAHFDGPSVDFANLAGLIKGPPPWPKNTAQLRQRLEPAGLTPLSAEGQVLHIHEHLDIFVNGKHVTVPAFIGIKAKKDGNLDFITELHTHGTDGLIHLESTKAQTYSLGQFFASWGLNLSKDCVGGLCFPPEQIKFYVNGKEINGDPVKLVLEPHQEIAIVYGNPPDHIPSSYNFPAGT
jgi:hypothetical protein